MNIKQILKIKINQIKSEIKQYGETPQRIKDLKELQNELHLNR